MDAMISLENNLLICHIQTAHFQGLSIRATAPFIRRSSYPFQISVCDFYTIMINRNKTKLFSGNIPLHPRSV